FRLQYMYFYHGLLAAIAALARIDYFHAMIVLNAIALGGCGLMFHALTGLFTRMAGPRIAGLCVWLFAMNGWFYLFYPLRIARALGGASHGATQLHAFFPWTPNGHDTALQLIAVEGNQFMFLDKFMLGTAFSLTLAPAAAVLFLLLRGRQGYWSARHDAAFVLSIAGMAFLHVVTGATVAVATLLVLGLLMITQAQPGAGGPPYARLAGWIGAGIAVTVPYLMSTLPHAPANSHAGPSISFALQPAYALGLLADVLPALVLAIVFLRGWRTDRDHEGLLGARWFSELSLSATGMLVLWTCVVAAIALTVDLVTNNETKFAFLLQLPLAIFATGGLARMWGSRARRRGAMLLVVSATLPLHALYYHHAVRDPSVFTRATGERAAYDWIAQHTPANAVFIDENDTVDVPVFASRDLYWGTKGYAHNWGYDPEEMVTRERLRDAVYSPEGMDAQDRLRLRALGRPVFVIYRTRLDEFTDDAERFLAFPGFVGRFTAERTTVFELNLDLDAE
ncbi:MAG TPA: hypothetical protein VFX92_05760, partial [Candidatus Krumholzibacteria bacterium]|nr:hypothetical protein [Candidatus Krumholzibacteria bacterium]